MADIDYTVAGARPEDVSPACRMMLEAYSEFLLPEMEVFEDSQTFDPSFEPEQLRLLRKDSRIVATVRVFLREVRGGAGWLRMGGIGNVAVHPDFRGQGLSIAVLSDALQFMQGQGVDFSMLYASAHGLYGKLGYELRPRSSLSGRVPGEKKTLSGGYGLEDAARLYDLNIGQCEGAFRRSEEYWRVWVSGIFLKKGSVVYSPSGDAYVIYRETSDGRVELLDGGFGADPGELTRLVQDAFSGREISLKDTDETHPLSRSALAALPEPVLKEARSLMVLPMTGAPLPSRLLETMVDRF